MADAVIRTTALTKRYGRQRGIEDLDLEVPRGSVFGYLGPNGAGKTTTIRLLLDLIRPSAGRAEVFGLDSHRDTIAIRRRLTYLPGELRLYEGLSGVELLTHFAALRGGVAAGSWRDLAERLDCDLERRIGDLSHGNRQKLGLIQALMGDPELIILDEPTQGLDPLVQQTFVELISEARVAGRTVFFSSHILPEIERTCDTVAIVREGRLIALERVADLKRRAFRRLAFRFDGIAEDGAGAGPSAGSSGGLVAGPPEALFAAVAAVAAVPGTRVVHAGGSEILVEVVGPVAPLLAVVAARGVLDVTSHEPSLEDVFLEFYGRGNNHAEGG